MTKVYCNTRECTHNEDDVCTAAMIYCVNRKCRTHKKVNTHDLMQGMHGSHCKKSGGSYKSTDVKILNKGHGKYHAPFLLGKEGAEHVSKISDKAKRII